MGMPRDLVLVRHGQSEANIVQKGIKDEGFEIPEGFFDRHDSEMLLSQKGIEQAKKTGEFLRQEFPTGFDHYYVSSLTRTIQTAGNLALGGNWIIDDRLRERDWGEYTSMNDTDQIAKFADSYKLRQQNKYYWCPPGGESMATGVRLRWDRILNTMHREMEGDTYIGVSHGDTINVARIILERMLIPEWLEQDRAKTHEISNTQVLHWTRMDPETGEDAGKLLWRRSICPWDPSKSWNNGQWEKLIVDRRFSDEQLLEIAALQTPLFPEHIV